MIQFDERFELNENAKENIIYNEHIVRYELAKEFVKDKTVLEIACGSGYGSKMLAKAGAKEVIAMDIDEGAVNKAMGENEIKNLKFEVGNAEAISLGDDSVDTLVSFETIEHLKKPEIFLSEAKRVLGKNGVLLISTPNYEASKNKNPYHEFEYKKEEFEVALKKYFKFVEIFDQGNSMATVIDLGRERNIIHKTSVPKAQFFIAICANEEMILPDNNFQSLNAAALKRLYGNLKIMDAVYKVVTKVPGVKKLMSLLKK